MPTQTPAPPPGFELVAPKSNMPPPPPGFEMAAPLAKAKTFQRDEDEQLYQKMLSQYNASPVRQSGFEHITNEERARGDVQRIRAKEVDEAQFAESRTPLQRVHDTVAGVLSVPVRALTKGKYGLGDIVGSAIPSEGGAIERGEQRFARANKGWLEPVARVGEASLGIPMLQSMGAVPGQMMRTAGGAMSQTRNRLLPNVAPRATPQATPAQAYGPAQRIIDRQAFVDEGIPEFAPAFTSKGTARVAKTIEEFPLVGGTVKTPRIGVEQAMANRQAQIAQQAGAASSPEDVGRITQGGLSRFRGSQLQDLERSRVQQLGLTPDRPAQQTAGNVSVSRPSQLNTAAMTDDQLEAAAKAKVDLPGSTRSTLESLSPKEIERIVKLPARDTSFPTKAGALYKQAEDAVPALMRSNDAVNPGFLATRNAGRVVQGLMRQEKSASIKGGVLQGRFGDLVQKLANPKSNMTLESMRAARTEIGKALDNFGQFDTGLDRKQLKALYGSISDDYQSGLVALAARARTIARANPKDSSVLATANAADKALHRYRVADRYYRNGIERMDRFMKVVGAETLEQASKKIGSYLKENTQNIRALESVSSSLRPEEWRSVLGHVIEDLGKLTPGAKEAERVFSFERFATDWNKISQNPRVTELFRRSLGGEVMQSLQNMGRIAERMKYYETTKNYSGSGLTAMTGGGLMMLLDPTLWPALVGSVAGAGATGKVLTSRSFARWVNSLNRAQVQVGSSVQATKQALRPHVQRLLQIATREPDPDVARALQALAVSIDQQLMGLDRQ